MNFLLKAEVTMLNFSDIFAQILKFTERLRDGAKNRKFGAIQTWNPNWKKKNLEKLPDVCKSCRPQQMLQNEPLVAKIGFDTAEKGASEV